MSSNIQSDSQQITPELLAAALKLAREQEQSTTIHSSGPSDDHLFQLLQLVKSLGGIDKVQELLNNYNYNKKPFNLVGSVDFSGPNAEIYNHNRHLDSHSSLMGHDNGPILQPNADYASPQRQNSRVINRQSTTTISPFLNPNSYVTPQNRPTRIEADYQPTLTIDHNDGNNLEIPRNTQPRQRRPQKIESTTENLPLLDHEATSSRTRSPFSFVYNEPMLRNNAPSNSIYENVDESLLAVTEPSTVPQRSRTRQRGRTASTALLIEQPNAQPIEGSIREQPRPRIRGSSTRSNNNNHIGRDHIGNQREQPANVDGFFLYNTPTRSTRQPSIVEPILNNQQDKPRRNQNSRSRIPEVSFGNSYSVPARVTSLSNERSTGVETAPSSASSTRKKKPAKVRMSTGFIVNESPVSPGVTYDEESDIYIPFNNEPRSNTRNNNANHKRRNENLNVNNNLRNSFTHHHSHNVLDNGVNLNVNIGPNSIEIPSMNDSPPEPTIISRKPSPIRRRPPQRQHILNNPNALVEGEFSNQPTSSEIEDSFVRNQKNNNNRLSSTRATTLNPFSSYNSVGLSSVSAAADIESTRISSSSNQPINSNNNGPSIHSLADDLESNYNSNNNGNSDLFNYNIGNTSPVVTHDHSATSDNTNSAVSNDLNTTPYLTTITERSIVSHSLNPTVTESIISSTIQTTTQSPSSTFITSSLATTASPLKVTSNNGNNLNIRRSRPRTNSNSRNADTTPQPKQAQPKRVTNSPVTSAPSVRSNSGSSDSGEPITWDQTNNKVTCNRRGVYIHPQSCGQFVVCAPSKGSIKTIQHHCPAGQVFVKEVGRCKPGDRNTCLPTARAA